MNQDEGEERHQEENEEALAQLVARILGSMVGSLSLPVKLGRVGGSRVPPTVREDYFFARYQSSVCWKAAGRLTSSCPAG